MVFISISNFGDIVDFQAQICLTICLSMRDKIEMNNDQTGLILPKISMLGGAFKKYYEI